ncbi:MAG TPA: pyridoxal 5'-phosphate synthase [Gammaproteobacteria bacterium]
MSEAGDWLDLAFAQRVQRHPNAMTLATVGLGSRPSARIVLLKDLSRDQGFATFYTHYESRKAVELDRTGRAAAVLHWDELGRQIRFEGPVVRSPDAESDAYFATRSVASQINARVSAQSRPLDNLADLIARAKQQADDLGMDMTHPGPGSLDRPPFWGGYRLWIEALELWREGADRFHLRLRYERVLEQRDAHHFDSGAWSCRRLQP